MENSLIVDLQMLDKQAQKCHKCSVKNNSEHTKKTSLTVDVAYASIILQKFKTSHKQVQFGPVKF